MKSEELEDRMRQLEYFHSLTILPGVWCVIRVDGRSFSRFTAERFEKPFDEQFRDHMVSAARALLDELKGVYAYTESDEISILLPLNWSLFDRELEKAVSLSAGIVSSAFTLSCGTAAHFDSRVWLGPTKEDVVDYFRWRQGDAARCALNGWAYWTLRNAGTSMAEATARLSGMSVGEKNELLFQHGINFNNVPEWQRRGVGLYWEEYEKPGTNPVTGAPTSGTRRRIKVDLNLPMREAYDRFISEFLGGSGVRG